MQELVERERIAHANTVENIRAESIVQVTCAEEEQGRMAGERIRGVERELEDKKKECRVMRDEIGSLKRSMESYRDQNRNFSASHEGHAEEKERVLGALRLVVRCLLPCMRRVSELRCEKQILWGLVKDSWVWERSLIELADAADVNRAATKQNTTALSSTRPTLRSVVVCVIAANRLQRLGFEGRRKVEMISPSSPNATSPRKYPFHTPQSSTPSSTRSFTPHHQTNTIYTGGKRRRANTNTNFNGLLEQKHVESDLTTLGQRLPTVEGNGGERDLEAVVSAMVIQDVDTPNVVSWMKGGGWGDGGQLVHDLNRGLMEWIRKGGRAGGGGRGEELVGGVRRGMGVLARRVKEGELREVRDKRERELRRSELSQLREMNSQMQANLKSSNENNHLLEERSQALAAECLESVPQSRLSALNEDLLHEKKMHTELARKHAELQSKLAEIERGREFDMELIDTVKAELDRTHKQLEGERMEIKRLRTESEMMAAEGKKKKSAKKKAGNK